MQSKKIIYFGSSLCLAKKLKPVMAFTGNLTIPGDLSVWIYCKFHGIPIYHFNKANDILRKFIQAHPNTAEYIGICYSCSRIIKKDIVEKLDIINFHDGELPKYAGLNSIQRALDADEKK